MTISKEDALRAYAAMMNTLDVSKLEDLLAEDFHYSSQWVFSELESKSAYLEYIVGKLQAVKKSGDRVWAEMGWLDHELPGPCVIVAQGEQENLIAVVLAEVGDGQIKRLNLCCVPSPHFARRTGIYPAEAKHKQ